MANAGTNRSARTPPNNQITGIVTSKLICAGVSPADATQYAQFLQEIGNYVATDDFLADALSAKDTREGLIRALSANKLLQNGRAMNLTSSLDGFSTVRKVAGLQATNGGLGLFVSFFERYSKSHGIQLNECSLAVSKMALDFGGAAGGGAIAFTPIGLALAGTSLYFAYKDSYGLGKACFSSR